MRQLPEADMEQLEKFLRSPFFDVPAEAVVLFGLLQPSYPHFKDDLPTAEVLFESIFPGKEYRAELLNTAFHTLFLAVKNYLAHTRLAQDTLLSKRLFMQQTLELGMMDHFQKSGGELLKKLETSIGQPIGTYHGRTDLRRGQYLRFCAHSELFLYGSPEKYAVSTEQLQSAIEALDLHFILNRLFLAIEMENRQQFLDESASLPFQQELELFAQRHIAPVNNETKLYLEVLQLFRHQPDIKLIRAAKDNLLASLTNINAFDAQTLLGLHINQLLRLGKSTGVICLDDIIQLYEQGLATGLIPGSARFPSGTFINIANAYSQASKFADGRRFILRYQERLHPPEKLHIVSLCTAYLLFYEGKFQEAFDQFNLVELGHISFRHALVARPLFLRCLFEIWVDQAPPREDRISPAIDAFRQFFRRNKILNAKEKKRYIDFAAILSSIVKYGATGWPNERAKERLLKKCQSSPFPYAHTWLQEKITGIK